MRDDVFRAWLRSGGYTEKAIATRLSRCRLVERLLHVDLDIVDLQPAAIMEFRRRLEDQRQTDAVLASALNAVRTYRRFLAGEPAGHALVERPITPELRLPLPAQSASPPASLLPIQRTRTPTITTATNSELMTLHSEVLDELRTRGILRTANGPVGDFAEHLFAQAFGWTLQTSSTAGYDAVDASGVRYQIKGRRLTGVGSRQLEVIRRIDERAFDVLAAVLFAPKFFVQRAALIPFHTVLSRARRVQHVNGWRFMLTDAVWSIPGVVDVTTELRNTPL